MISEVRKMFVQEGKLWHKVQELKIKVLDFERWVCDVLVMVCICKCVDLSVLPSVQFISSVASGQSGCWSHTLS